MRGTCARRYVNTYIATPLKIWCFYSYKSEVITFKLRIGYFYSTEFRHCLIKNYYALGIFAIKHIIKSLVKLV